LRTPVRVRSHMHAGTGTHVHNTISPNWHNSPTPNTVAVVTTVVFAASSFHWICNSVNFNNIQFSYLWILLLLSYINKYLWSEIRGSHGYYKLRLSFGYGTTTAKRYATVFQRIILLSAQQILQTVSVLTIHFTGLLSMRQQSS
jgi:hypothetical protein